MITHPSIRGAPHYRHLSVGVPDWLFGSPLMALAPTLLTPLIVLWS